MRWHPWRHLRDLAHVRVEYRDDMPPGLLGYTAGDVIYLRKGLKQDERRCTLTHELVHYIRGDKNGCSGPDEELVKIAAARLLIEIHPLVDAMRWTMDWHAVAELLWVDLDTLRTRMSHLHPAESLAIRRATEHHREDHQ